MTALLLSILSEFWPIILAVLGALGWGYSQRRAGASAQKAKQAQQDAKARDIADAVDNDIGAMPPDEARKELGEWAR